MYFNDYGSFAAVEVSRDWSAIYKQMLSYMPVSSLHNVRANAAREGIVLDAQGNVIGTLNVYASPSTDELAALITTGKWSVENVAALLASTQPAPLATAAKAVEAGGAPAVAPPAQKNWLGGALTGAASGLLLGGPAGVIVGGVAGALLLSGKKS